MSKTCNLFINYVLEEPPYLEKRIPEFGFVLFQKYQRNLINPIFITISEKYQAGL